REFHRKDDRSGLRYWRVTGTADLGDKAEYQVSLAADRVREHAKHFTTSIREELAAHRKATGRDGMLVTTFDSELFGHWWFEGIDWLRVRFGRVGGARAPRRGRAARAAP